MYWISFIRMFKTIFTSKWMNVCFLILLNSVIYAHTYTVYTNLNQCVQVLYTCIIAVKFERLYNIHVLLYAWRAFYRLYSVKKNNILSPKQSPVCIVGLYPKKNERKNHQRPITSFKTVWTALFLCVWNKRRQRQHIYTYESESREERTEQNTHATCIILQCLWWKWTSENSTNKIVKSPNFFRILYYCAQI